MTSALRPAADAEAQRLGIETTYVDAAGVRHAAEPRSVAAVLDVLVADADRSRATVRSLQPVVVVGGPDGAEPPDVSASDDLQLTLADGSVVTGSDVQEALQRLPVGCHRLDVADGATTSTTTVVMAPAQMPSALPSPSGRLPASLFTPTYGLWSSEDPLPGFHHLGRLAADVAGHGCAVVFTLPLYDLFLDTPCEPSPYSPASRQHWNELFVDDASLPAAPVPPGIDGPVLDLSALAARRRRQLLEAAASLDGVAAAELDAFVAERPDVAAYARFRASRAGGRSEGVPVATVERSYALAQHLAHRQLTSVAGAEGAGIGLDLPIGGHPDGFETWAHPDHFATGFRVGAPPDPLAAEGQDWGFPPQLPGAGRRSGHELWRTLVDRSSEHAAVLRLDHVMAVHRLWWIPPGAPATDGVYVRYPADEIAATIAATAAARGTAVVGENLGTVPPEVDALVARWGMLGLHEEGFHLDDPTLVTIPPHAVAGIRTHDMEPLALAAARTTAPAYRRAAGESLLDVVLARLAASDAAMVVADIDDLLELTEPHNRPGITGGSTWRRRLPIAVEDVAGHPVVRRRLRLLASRRMMTTR